MNKGRVVAGGAGQARERRVATHSHIKGLGLGKDGKCMPNDKCGFVGQNNAREGAGVLVDMVKSKKMAGFALLITGPSGSGKTALALGMSQELGEMVPFCPMVGSEVYSAEVRKTEVLQEMMRRSIALKVREIKEVWEGEVVEMLPHETVSSSTTSSSSTHISHVDLVLRAQKGTKTLKMDPEIWDSLMRQKVKVGDIIIIESGNGALKRLGRSEALRPEADLEADTYLPLPRGEVYKTKEVLQEVTLHDLDVANSRPSPRSLTGGPNAFMNQLMSQMMQGQSNSKGHPTISAKLRGEVDLLVNKYLESGTAELSPGVLFIDEAHMLDLDCFTFLNRALESPISPIIVFATNRTGVEVVRGSSGREKSPHGIPHELLDRLLIVRTESLPLEEVPKVIDYRLKMENGPLPFGEEALSFLAALAIDCSLRYCLQLLTPSSLLAIQNGKTVVEKEDVDEASMLFLDTKRSTNLLEKRMVE